MDKGEAMFEITANISNLSSYFPLYDFFLITAIFHDLTKLLRLPSWDFFCRLNVWLVVESESSVCSASWLGMDLATLLWSSG